ncbi:MAG: nucleoside phosphorylase [Candidatus Helarchaeota archaeon]
MDSYLVRLQLDCNPRKIADTILLPATEFVQKKMISKLIDARKFGKVYTGSIKDSSIKISIVPSGMGSPSAAIIVETLARAGIKKIIRLDFCGGISDEIRIGDIVISPSAIRGDGTTPHYLDYNENLEIDADKHLTNYFITQFESEHIKIHKGPVYSHDALFREPEILINKIKQLGAIAIDMETSAIYTVSKIYKIPTTAIMIVSDHPAKKKFFYNRETFRLKILRNLDKAIKVVIKSILKSENNKKGV